MSRDDDNGRWHYPRPDLATNYLRQFSPGPAEAITLFAQRRAGKTAFLRHDLTPAAVRQKLQPVYIDLWANVGDPARAIAEGFESATRTMEDPSYTFGKVLGKFDQEVTGIKAFGFGVSTKPREAPKPSEDTISRIGFWAERMVAASKHPILLMVDEVQSLASASDGVEASSALRAALQRSGPATLRPVFTGSSRDGLLRMFNESNAAFFEYGASPAFPSIDAGIAGFMAQRLHESAGLSVDTQQLAHAFDQLGRLPGPFKRMVIAMNTDRSADVPAYTQRQLGEIHARAEMRADALSPLQTAIVAKLAAGQPLFTKDALADMAKQSGRRSLQQRTVQDNIEHLRRAHVAGKAGYGDYYIEDADVGKIVQARLGIESMAIAKQTDAATYRAAADAWLKDTKAAAKKWPDLAKSMSAADAVVRDAAEHMRKGGAQAATIEMTSQALRQQLANDIATGKRIEIPPPTRNRSGPER